MRHFFILLVFLSLVPMLVFAGNTENGEKIYKKKCKGCHRITEGVLVGPSLLGVTKRRTEEWIREWIQNPKAMIKKGDPVALELAKKFKKHMRTLKIMQDEKNRDDIISFLKKLDNQ